MKTQDTSRLVREEYYQIRIDQHLDPECSAWLAGMTIMNLAEGAAILSGVLLDQAALYGVLQTLHDMNVTLLDLRRGNNCDTKSI